MTDLGRADLLGRPVFSAFSQEQSELERVLASGHPGAIAGYAIAVVDRADTALIAAIGVLACHDAAGLDGALVAAVACLRMVAEHGGPRAALPVARGLDVIAHAIAGRAARPASPSAGTLPLDALAGALAEASVAQQGGDAAEHAVRRAAAGGADVADLAAAVVDRLYAEPARCLHLAPVVLAAVEVAQVADRPTAVDVLARLARTLLLRGHPAEPGDGGPRPGHDHVALVAPMAAAAAQLHGAQDPAKAAAFQEARFRPHLLGGKPAVLVRAVAKALAFGIPRGLVASSLCLAAAERLLRFDPAVARSVRRQETWLDMGWLLQITEAVRALGALHDRPAWIGLLLHTALWVREAAALDAAALAKPGAALVPAPETLARTWDHGPEIARVTGAMLRGDAQAAMATVRGYLLMVLPEQPLASAIAAAALEDRAASAAEQGALLATVVAALASFGAANALPHRDLLPCAALHLWAAPVEPRPVFSLTHAAVDRAEGGQRAVEPSPLPWIRAQISD